MKPIQTAVIALSLVFSSVWADTHLPDSVGADVVPKDDNQLGWYYAAKIPQRPTGSHHFENYRPEGRAASHAPTSCH